MTSTNCLDTALELLNCHHLWPIAIKPGEKAPIGTAWGTNRPTEQSIKATFRSNPGAGVGLLLGPESGIIDVECDGPEGIDSLTKLMSDEIVATLGWSSRRGPHHVFRYDTRLAGYGKSIIKLPELPGLEIRVGGNGKQLQSNCPPTMGEDGKPREWNDCPIIADPPEAMFSFLDAVMEQAAIQSEPSGGDGEVTPSPGPWPVIVKAAGRLTADERCEKYLATIDPGVQGQDGSRPMMRAAAIIVRFGITDSCPRDIAFERLSGYGARCSPPWTDEKEINHKLDDAIRLETRRDYVNEDPPESKATCSGSNVALDPSQLLVRADQIMEKDIVWLWQDRIPCGFLTVFAGRTGVGKSFVAFDVVARVTTGREWPDQPGVKAPVGSVVIFSEDPQSKMSVPRLRTMGADLTKVYFVTWEAMVQYELSDIDMLDLIVRQAGAPRLVIIDPPQNFLGETDENSNVQVRKVLMGLVKWVDTRPDDTSIVLITQVNKGTSDVAAVDRILGSVAWAATSRIAHTFAPDKDVKSGGFFSCPKTNLGEIPDTLRYHIVKVGKQAKVEWDGTCAQTADQVMQASMKKSAADKAVDWVIERFREKREWLSDELKNRAMHDGISTWELFKGDTIKALPIHKYHPINPGPWYWEAMPPWPG